MSTTRKEARTRRTIAFSPKTVDAIQKVRETGFSSDTQSIERALIVTAGALNEGITLEEIQLAAQLLVYIKAAHFRGQLLAFARRREDGTPIVEEMIHLVGINNWK